MKNKDLHGFAPDTSPVALLILDMMNTFEFEGGDGLLKGAIPAAHAIAQLKNRCRAKGIPCIYVNDNFGRWQSNFQALIEHCMKEGCKGRDIAELLRPEKEDYFVLKPKHSGFFSTTLELLLSHLQVSTLILTGIAGNICLLFTAGDAHMRDYRIVVPRDCTASNSTEDNQMALEQMHKVLQADIAPSDQIDLGRLKKRAEEA